MGTENNAISEKVFKLIKAKKVQDANTHTHTCESAEHRYWQLFCITLINLGLLLL